MIKITSQQNILLLARRIILMKMIVNLKNFKNEKKMLLIGTIRVIFDNYNVVMSSLVPGHSKNYIAADKPSLNVSINMNI